MAFASTSTEFAMIDTRTTSGAFVLPLTTAIPGRIINIKDAYGAFTTSSLTVYTQGGELFEDGTNFKILNNSWDQLQVYTASTTRWYITGGTEQNITTTNIGVFSTIQTFNWPSLCNTAFFGYGSTFNPTAIGRIALLDNIFTSSTAALASTFIEMGNLNSQPANMTAGGAFRWLMGVEQDPASAARGLQFKIKRWNSYNTPTGAFFYGASLSTLIDTVNINSLGFVGINNSNPSYALDVRGGASFSNLNTSYGHLKLLPNSNGGETAIAFYSTTTVNDANLWMLGRNASWGTAGNLAIVPVIGNSVTHGLGTYFLPTGQVGINTTTPFSTLALDVNGLTRGRIFLSTVTTTSLTVLANSYGIYHNLTNTGFNALTLTALTGATSNQGWYVTLRNATNVAMSITVSGTACNNIPSPLSIGSSNSATLYWDGALFRVI